MVMQKFYATRFRHHGQPNIQNNSKFEGGVSLVIYAPIVTISCSLFPMGNTDYEKFEKIK